MRQSSGSVGVHAFEVTIDGLIAYAPEKEPFFDGAGTAQPTVVGYDVVIDATALTSHNQTIGGIGFFPDAPTTFGAFEPGNRGKSRRQMRVLV